MILDEDIRIIERKRNRLERGAVYALALISFASAVGWIDPWTEALTPQPDYYAILFRDLAEQHFQNTTTPTVVREEPRTLEFFAKQYEAKSKFLGLPPVTIRAPESGLLSFSYQRALQEVMGLKATSETAQISLGNPSTNLARPGVALWLYSKEQHLMACFACVPVDAVLLSNPEPWLDRGNLLAVDRLGAVTIEGTLPDDKLAPIVADLVVLGDLRLENLDHSSQQDPDLGRLDYLLPMVNPPGISGSPPRATAQATIERLRDEAAAGFLAVRWCSRLLFPLIGLLWLARNFRRLGRLYQQCNRAVQARTTMGQASLTYTGFLRGGLGHRLVAAVAEARAEQYALGAKEREKAERVRLADQLHRYKAALPLTPAQAALVDKSLSNGTTDAMRNAEGMCLELERQHKLRVEKEQQFVRDTTREIERLQREIQAVPLDKRDKEARECWSLYQRSATTEDLRERLRLLKLARKKMPRELRPERF